MNEFQRQRHRALAAIMDEQGLDALVLHTPANFAWFTGGGDNRVDHSAPAGVASIVARRDDCIILTSTIESARISAEETPGLEVIDCPWYEGNGDVLRTVTGNGSVGSDLPAPGQVDVSGKLQMLRIVLDAESIDRYRVLGQNTVAAVEQAAASLAAGITEFEAAGRLLEACLSRGLYAPVVMAAGEDRISAFRHPIPRNTACRTRVMLVVCAELGGLYASLTRFVHFEPPDPAWERRQAACNRILQRMRAEATMPGRTLGDAFEDCRRFYADEGFPEEWKLHHQGGMAGFATREFVATPGLAVPIAAGQAFAWNPSITGAKAEETFVLTESQREVIAGQTPV